MGLCRSALLLLVLASGGLIGPARAQPSTPPPPQPVTDRIVLLPPPIQWDAALLGSRPALQQTATDFANLTGGVAFGMSPADLNAILPEPYAGVSWNALSLASEYPGEVRYLGVPIGSAGVLRLGMTGCAAPASYVVFLFTAKGLFRMSYRLLADKVCQDTNDAAQQIFARYVPIGQNVALSARYRAGKTEIVDITDPTAGYLIPVRWRQGGN